LSGGVVLYAAQSNVQVDAEIAEKGRFQTKTKWDETVQITIKLLGTFRIDRFREEKREYPAGIKVLEIVEELQISSPLSRIVLINGVHASVDHTLNDGDTLSLLPIVNGG